MNMNFDEIEKYEKVILEVVRLNINETNHWITLRSLSSITGIDYDIVLILIMLMSSRNIFRLSMNDDGDDYKISTEEFIDKYLNKNVHQAIKDMNEQMFKAVEDENYEYAAYLRDTIAKANDKDSREMLIQDLIKSIHGE